MDHLEEEENEPTDEQVYGVLIAYQPGENKTVGILYGQYGSEIYMERDADLQWWAKSHQMSDGDSHDIEPPYNVPNPVGIAQAIANGNDHISEGLNSLLAEEDA